VIKLYKATFGTDRTDIFFKCIEYEMDDFDLMTFWRGERFEGVIPEGVRIIVGDGEPPDFTLLPMSWYVFSDRAAARIARRAGEAVQFFDAPLYHHKTRGRIGGYKILNATRRNPCFDLNKSTIRYDSRNPARIEAVLHYAFDEALIPKDLHVFRAAEHFVLMFFSKLLVDDLMTGETLKNLAFLEYGGDEIVELWRWEVETDAARF
jgi:hypothetical protein